MPLSEILGRRLALAFCPGTAFRLSTAHLAVKQRSPLSINLSAARRHNLHLASIYRAIAYTRLRFLGLHPLCGMGVISLMLDTTIPLACIALIAASRPLPGPLINTSTCLMPASL